MTYSQKLNQVVWLLTTIHSAGRITFREINDRWQQSSLYEGQPISETTFWRHRKMIEDMFKIEIGCSHENYEYFYSIANPQILKDNSLQSWMLKTLTYAYSLSDCASIQDRILLEPQAQDQEQFATIISALRQNQRVHLCYKHLGVDELQDIDIDPLCIKYFEQRWYVLGRVEGGNYRTYAVDRIQSVKLLPETFKLPKDFNASIYYHNAYGIVAGPDIPPAETILVRVFGKDIERFKSIPLHHSQKLISEEPSSNSAVFSLFLHPTNDFIGRLISRTYNVQVLQPQHLVDELTTMMKDTLKHYGYKF